MTERTIVFKTPGKLDLRALTVFGMNAKPNTNSPIGFFGTGLKYAMAVLARENLPVTIYTNDVMWEIKANETNFRGKDFKAIQLFRHKKWLGTAVRDLPFTTEFGKTWELWQAFRELYSNTLDENGEAFISEENLGLEIESSYTYIVVEGERFVQEYIDREKTFLPDAIRQQTNYEAPVQVVERPSNAIYYRGIRVYDLPKGTISKYTYNILCPVDLTEDRTAKYPFCLAQIIEAYAQRTDNVEHIRSIVDPEPKTWESKLTWDYGHYTPPSKVFLETVTQVKAPSAAVRDFVKPYLPKPRVKPDIWLEALIGLLEFKPDPMLTDLGDEAKAQFADKVWEDKDRMLRILTKVKEESTP